MRSSLKFYMSLCLCCFSNSSFAYQTLTPEPDGQSYNFVMHYRVTVKATPEQVWPVLVDLKSWMYEFDLSSLSGAAAAPGQVLNLYEGQDFRIQITSVVPNQMLAMANLPLEFRGEYGTGIGVMTLHKNGATTEVSLTMSRRYTWRNETPNPNLKTRESTKFSKLSKAMWEDRFLARLKQLAERRGSGE